MFKELLEELKLKYKPWKLIKKVNRLNDRYRNVVSDDEIKYSRNNYKGVFETIRFTNENKELEEVMVFDVFFYYGKIKFVISDTKWSISLCFNPDCNEFKEIIFENSDETKTSKWKAEKEIDVPKSLKNKIYNCLIEICDKDGLLEKELSSISEGAKSEEKKELEKKFGKIGG